MFIKDMVPLAFLSKLLIVVFFVPHRGGTSAIEKVFSNLQRWDNCSSIAFYSLWNKIGKEASSARLPSSESASSNFMNCWHGHTHFVSLFSVLSIVAISLFLCLNYLNCRTIIIVSLIQISVWILIKINVNLSWCMHSSTSWLEVYYRIITNLHYVFKMVDYFQCILNTIQYYNYYDNLTIIQLIMIIMG